MLRNDLHVYLKILQSAMVELINKDYADFVNLSTNLVCYCHFLFLLWHYCFYCYKITNTSTPSYILILGIHCNKLCQLWQ